MVTRGTALYPGTMVDLEQDWVIVIARINGCENLVIPYVVGYPLFGFILQTKLFNINLLRTFYFLPSYILRCNYSFNKLPKEILQRQKKFANLKGLRIWFFIPQSFHSSEWVVWKSPDWVITLIDVWMSGNLLFIAPPPIPPSPLLPPLPQLGKR